MCKNDLNKLSMRRKIKNWVSRCSKLSLGCKLMMVLLLFTHFAFSSENAFGQQTITVQFEKQSLRMNKKRRRLYVRLSVL